ncbi:MAG: ADP-ribosylglycohydrolase family protein [Muribaculaceae bacterium]|nr:ADP-ribosylglycohydrolase family protein [Muribaculaceae bacterium]
MELKDKIKGALYGMALGDSLGLGTIYMTRREIKSYYPDGLTRHNQFIRDMHRSMYHPGEWTGNTEVILRILDPILADERIDLQHIAGSLKRWYDEGPVDLATPYRFVIPATGWVKDPKAVSHRTWRSNHILDASNEALLRSLIIGIFARNNLEVADISRSLVNITHDDSRCVATTAVAALYAKSFLNEESEPSYQTIVQFAREIDERALEFIRLAHDGDLLDFRIDDEATWWYSRKSLGVVLWALWNCPAPSDILHTLVNAGGDTNANASLAMMLAGLRDGYQALPDIKNDIIGKERLDDYAERLTGLVETLRARK